MTPIGIYYDEDLQVVLVHMDAEELWQPLLQKAIKQPSIGFWQCYNVAQLDKTLLEGVRVKRAIEVAPETYIPEHLLNLK